MAFAAATIAFAGMTAQAAPDEPTPQQMVDALHTTFGTHHARAVHAKGIIVEGSFTPALGARAITRAKLFSAASVRVIVRFSDFTGIPDIPDNVGDANPRGFAVKFKMPDGDGLDVVAHSFNGFPTRTSAEFRELLLAIAASGPAAPKPTPLDAFLSTHPHAKTFLTTQKSPESYATTPYFGVNAFKFTAASGKSVYGRYRFAPAAGEHYLAPAEMKARPADFLQSDIRERLAKGPVAFDWFAQIAEKDDAIDDPSVAWPAKRRLVKLGTITLNTVADQDAEDRKLLFLPATLPSGIEAADPMLTVRNSAYPISFAGRQ